MPLPAPLRFYLLGTFRVENDTGVVKLPTKSTAALLAYLVLYRNDWLERARLATLFWGSEHANELRRRRTNESTDTLARTSFRRALSTLRKLLGPDLILDSDDGKRITLNPALSVWVDAEEFADTVALPLYRDDLLADFEDDPDAPWLEGPRAQYRELCIQASLQLAHDARTRGEWSRVVEFAQFALRRDAYQETAVQHLMVAYARQGEPQAALKAYAELEHALSEDLGTAPAASTHALLRHIERSAAKPDAAQLTNLPTPLAPFLGREAELAQLRALLESSRLVTLVGTGGSGKTRLAIRLAREATSTTQTAPGRDVSSSKGHSQKRLPAPPKKAPPPAKHLYDDGVWWVRLEELDKDTGSVAQSIAQVLSLRGDAGRPLLDTLTEQLRDSRMLLVLDNCEHLITDCARVSEKILSACPHIKILATSRQPLHVAGETDFSVPPLPLPGERAKLSTVETSEAVQFFLHYARHARGDFKLGKENASAVAQICRRLDGIPLALELAAARVKTLPANYIAEHLDERFQLFAAPQHTVPRHQTLRAVLDWSYDLLAPVEQQVFEALSVFAARFTLDAAQFVCSGDGTRAADVLEGLADKSLVLVEFDEHDVAHYRLMETIREYAREKLAATEPAQAVYARLTEYYVTFAEQHQREYVVLEDQWQNLMTAVSFSQQLENDLSTVRLGHTLTEASFARGLYTDAQRFYPIVIAAADRLEEQDISLGALYSWGRAYLEQGFYERAHEIIQRLLRLAEMTHDDKSAALALYGLGWIAIEESRYEDAERLLDESIRLGESEHDEFAIARALLDLCRIAYRRGQHDRAETLVADAALRLKQMPPNIEMVEVFKFNALIARRRNDLERAEQYCREGVAYCQENQFRDGLSSMLFISGQVAEKRGDLSGARSALEAGREILTDIGDRKGAAYVNDFLGSVLLELGLLEEAEDVSMNALAALRSMRDDAGIITSSMRLGKTLLRQNRTDEACALWRDALQRAQELNDYWKPELERLLDENCN